ncbi:MAG: aminotransferase class I/II-fold pyridoxal phosphate-dependent enzyme [Lactobacillus sp.]|nr:aminotransferase class I/II-fold pyridoxal phosphate-dependent enzyme [Lactobacillus sp.]
MPKYDFETIIDRKHTNSWKWQVKDNELPMTTADMDFKVAPEILQAMRSKIDLAAFGYEYPTDEYFEAVSSWYKRVHHCDISPKTMRFATGVIPALTATVNYFTQTGDNVVVMTPVYNIFYNSIENSGRHVLANELQYHDFQYSIDWPDLEKKLADPLTTMMIICNPHNPIGHIWSKNDLERMLSLAKQNHVLVVSDEIHGDLALEGDYVPTFSLADQYTENLIALVSTSKTFNLASLHAATGIVKNPNLLAKFDRAINKYEVAEPNLLAIPATIAAYEKGDEWLKELKEVLRQNRSLLINELSKISPKLKVVDGQASYLAWIDISILEMSATEFCQLLREETGLLVTPGSVYHGNGDKFIRMNLAYPPKQFMDGVDRLILGIKKRI